MILTPEDLLKILLALIAGGVIGLEREFRDKAAGFRTLIFICLGAALFTILSAHMAGENEPTRIAANIVSGVGFLGAGVILRDGGKVVGLTTAATIWLTAALGMGIGAGQYLLSFAAAGITLLVLWVFPKFERMVAQAREEHTYEIVCGLNTGDLDALDALFNQSGLRITGHHKLKSMENITCTWQAIGSPKLHAELSKKLIHDPVVKELRY